MAVKGRQVKLNDPHDTTRVVDVSYASSGKSRMPEVAEL